MFDRTAVSAAELKTESCRKIVCAFLLLLQRRGNQTKFGLKKSQELHRSVKKIALPKKDKFTLHWVKLKMHWWTYNTLSENYHIPLYGRLPIQEYSWKCSVCQVSELQNELFDRPKPKIVRNSQILSFFFSKLLREYKDPKFLKGDIVHIPIYDKPFVRSNNL